MSLESQEVISIDETITQESIETIEKEKSKKNDKRKEKNDGIT